MADEQNISPELLLQAYASGVFPMAETADADEVFWVDPKFRGIIPLDGFHVSRSMGRHLRRGDFSVSFDTDFDQTLNHCADRAETWINERIADLYRQLFHRGFVHTCEIWREDRMIGGVYGVTLGAAFFGESMFSKETNASKTALFYLIERLNRKGFTLFDTQFLTDHLASLGAIEIPRKEYHGLLTTALSKEVLF